MYSKVSWHLLFPSSYTFSRARVNTPVLPVFVQPGSEEWVFMLEMDLMIRTSVKFYLLQKKECMLLFIQLYVKEKVIRTSVK